MNTQNSNNTALPLWLSALTAVFFLSNLFVFGGLAFFYPEIAFHDAGPSATFPIEFFAIRHIAFAFPLLYGLLKKDVKVLTTMYSIFFVMTVLDIGVVLAKGYYVPVIGELPLWGTIALGFGGFIAPVTLALWKLRSLAK